MRSDEDLTEVVRQNKGVCLYRIDQQPKKDICKCVIYHSIK